jgi:hypothetical protein
MCVNIVRILFLTVAIGSLLRQIVSSSPIVASISEPAAMLLLSPGLTSQVSWPRGSE